MMTRGTRGDVQPFVALARGLAERLGWMVTICTELRWRPFVLQSCAGLRRGAVRFRPSGGDTQARIERWEARWMMESKSEALQSLMMAFAEAEFFPSAPVIMQALERVQASATPAHLVISSFTLAGIGLLASQRRGSMLKRAPPSARFCCSRCM